MKEWKYLIGSADDFIGAPEWAEIAYKHGYSDHILYCDGWNKGCRILGYQRTITRQFDVSEFSRHEIIAQRTESFGNAIDLEFCKANPDHPDCKCAELKVELSDVHMKSMEKSIKSFSAATGLQSHIILGQDKPSKYSRPCKGVTVDVYDVLQAFAVTNPATQHAIKKLLCAGLRGHKDKMQDLTEALKSIERAIELEKE